MQVITIKHKRKERSYVMKLTDTLQDVMIMLSSCYFIAHVIVHINK